MIFLLFYPDIPPLVGGVNDHTLWRFLAHMVDHFNVLSYRVLTIIVVKAMALKILKILTQLGLIFLLDLTKHFQVVVRAFFILIRAMDWIVFTDVWVAPFEDTLLRVNGARQSLLLYLFFWLLLLWKVAFLDPIALAAITFGLLGGAFGLSRRAPGPFSSDLLFVLQLLL